MLYRRAHADVMMALRHVAPRDPLQREYDQRDDQDEIDETPCDVRKESAQPYRRPPLTHDIFSMVVSVRQINGMRDKTMLTSCGGPSSA